MKILLTGEGPTDCGQKRLTANGQVWEEGPVQIYLRKIAKETSFQIDGIVTVSKNTIRTLRTEKRQQRSVRGLSGHGIKAFFVAQAAKDQNCDIAAMYVDADTIQGESSKDEYHCKRQYDSIKKQVLEGLEKGSIKYAIAIVPMKMIECWMLGDSNAFNLLWNCDLDHQYFRTPELIWGAKHDPNSDYPKNKLNRALGECGVQACRDIFCQIAENSDIIHLIHTCPISFRDFYEQCKAIFECLRQNQT